MGKLEYNLNDPVEGFAPSHVRVNSESIRIAVGPPTLQEFVSGSNTATDEVKTTLVYPLGMTQAFSLPQQKQVVSLSEIGSRRNFMVPGKSISSIALSKTWIYGPNLLRALYAWYQVDNAGGTPIESLVGNAANLTPGLQISPGIKNVFLNLESDMFDHPFGLLIAIRDTQGDYMYASYFETCYITAHHMSPRADGMVMMENVSILPERQVPVMVDAVSVKTARERMSRGSSSSVASID